jgi:hypothetical protein
LHEIERPLGLGRLLVKLGEDTEAVGCIAVRERLTWTEKRRHSHQWDQILVYAYMVCVYGM